MSIQWLNTWDTGTNGLYAMKKKENVEKMKPLLTFWPPGPPLLAKLTVTWSADKMELEQILAIQALIRHGHQISKIIS